MGWNTPSYFWSGCWDKYLAGNGIMRTHSIIGLSVLTIGCGTYLSSGVLLLLGYSMFGLLLFTQKRSKPPAKSTSSWGSDNPEIDAPHDMFAEPVVREHVRKVANKITRAVGLKDDLFSFYVLKTQNMFFRGSTNNNICFGGASVDVPRTRSTSSGIPPRMNMPPVQYLGRLT